MQTIRFFVAIALLSTPTIIISGDSAKNIPSTSQQSHRSTHTALTLTPLPANDGLQHAEEGRLHNQTTQNHGIAIEEHHAHVRERCKWGKGISYCICVAAAAAGGFYAFLYSEKNN